MSVLKAKRKPSQFEVFHHFYKMRKEITDLLLRDFGYDLERADSKALKMFSGKPYEELTPEEKARYDKVKAKNEAFAEWFIHDERQVVVDCLRTIGEEIFVANSIYPTCMEELIERRIRQDRAVGQCYRLTQELQYAIETLPVDVNKYLRFADLIQTGMRRKMKKLAPKLSEKEFTDWYKSWFKNHYRIMSRQQRSNMDTLFNQLKEVTKCSTQSPSPMVAS